MPDPDTPKGWRQRIPTVWHATDALAVLIVAGQWSGLTRAAFGAPVFAALLDLVLVGLTLHVLLRWWQRGRLLPAEARFSIVLLGGYFVYAAIQTMNPNVPSIIVGLEGFRKTAFTMLAFLVVAIGATGTPRRFFVIVAGGSVVTFVWSIRQVFAPIPLEQQIIDTSGVSPVTFHAGQVLRAFAPTSGPFHLGILAASVMVISLVLARRGSAGWLAAGVVAGASLGFSLTRANMVGAAIGTVVVMALYGVGKERARAVSLGALPLLAVAVASLFASGLLAVDLGGSAATRTPTMAPASTSIASDNSAAASTSAEPDQSSASAAASSAVAEPDQATGSAGASNAVAEQPTPTPEPRGNLFEDKNLRLRFGYWADFTRAILERPAFGYGTSAAADGMSADYAGSGSTRFEPHSMYFKPALELGIPGLVLFLGILIWAVVASWRMLARERMVGMIALGLLFATGTSGLAGPMLDAYPFNLLFWAVLGWVARSSGESRAGTQHAMAHKSYR